METSSFLIFIKQNCYKPVVIGEFFPDIWSLQTVHCFSMLSFDSGSKKQRFPSRPEFSNSFII